MLVNKSMATRTAPKKGAPVKRAAGAPAKKTQTVAPAETKSVAPKIEACVPGSFNWETVAAIKVRYNATKKQFYIDFVKAAVFTSLKVGVPITLNQGICFRIPAKVPLGVILNKTTIKKAGPTCGNAIVFAGLTLEFDTSDPNLNDRQKDFIKNVMEPYTASYKARIQRDFITSILPLLPAADQASIKKMMGRDPSSRQKWIDDNVTGDPETPSPKYPACSIYTPVPKDGTAPATSDNGGEIEHDDQNGDGEAVVEGADENGAADGNAAGGGDDEDAKAIRDGAATDVKKGVRHQLKLSLGSLNEKTRPDINARFKGCDWNAYSGEFKEDKQTKKKVAPQGKGFTGEFLIHFRPVTWDPMGDDTWKEEIDLISATNIKPLSAPKAYGSDSYESGEEATNGGSGGGGVEHDDDPPAADTGNKGKGTR